ncbi:MAG TPA: nicotinate phosphoribosyltransferase, partial [Burkholderiaceae bacterium]
MRHFSERVLLSDLYEFVMLQAYYRRGMNDTATFEFFVRDLPAGRHFLVAAGLEQAVDYLSVLRCEAEDLAWLASSGRFGGDFIESLRDLRFTGDLDAMPEGTVFFPNEPILRITAPLREAQLAGSRIMNLLHYQTLVASKAARCVMAAGGKPLIDFGLNRAHGAEAALFSARAAYLAGFDGTATAIAAELFDIPVSGAMTHTFVQAHEREIEAFAAFARAFPESATLLIDTYDTERGAVQAVRAARWLEAEGVRVKAVRIDCGNLETLSSRARKILDDGDCRDIGVFVGGNLDEYAIHSLVERGAPIAGFGVGSRLNTSFDAPFLDCAYMLVEYAGVPRRRRSRGKATWPGRKQVFRARNAKGMMTGDTLGMHGDALPGIPLLQPVMRNGA